MPTSFTFIIPQIGGTELPISIEAGQSIIFVGANGSGKTRLGVFLESLMSPPIVQRIAAQKNLNLIDQLSLISLERATNRLRIGEPDSVVAGHKDVYRWNRSPATHLLSDFEALLQVLFAEHNSVASAHLKSSKLNPSSAPPLTKLNQLTEIWGDLLPHRTLETDNGAVKVNSIPASAGGSYLGSQMSDGERVIFYFLGQCLMAPDNGVVIIDEPENHVHRAILGILWDAVEQARPDCAFIYITHDLEFAGSRPSSVKYFLRAYEFGDPGKWLVEKFPEETGLSDLIVAELVGSRKPILFVEGERGSLDLTIYRSRYKEFTIVPVGSCEAVIRSVASFGRSPALHWLQVKGLVDADHREAKDIVYLKTLGVFVLPVAEVENLLLIPNVFLALAEALSCANPAGELANLTSHVMKEASANIDLICARYSARTLDSRLKRIEVSAKDLPTLEASYQSELGSIDPATIFGNFKTTLGAKINIADLPAVLQLYDNKGLLAYAASRLGLAGQKPLMEKVGRLLGSDLGENIRDELAKVLPEIV